MIPMDKIKQSETKLDRTEVEARVYNLLRQFDFMDLDNYDLNVKYIIYKKEDYTKMNMDSLEWTALVTSIEHEFHVLFEDNFYDHFRTINDVIDKIAEDHLAF
jgi:acyl carrier protein